MVATRDIKVGGDVAKMAALGKFEDEFAVYGVSYLQNGKVWHRVSSDQNELWEFAQKCKYEDVCPTVIQEWINRTLVPSGQRDEYMLNTKITMAKRLKQIFDEDFLKRLFEFAHLPNTNDAYGMLKEQQENLMGSFERDLLMLHESLIKEAFEAKKLSEASYGELMGWLEHVYRQMEDDVVIKKNFSRTFYGIGYMDESNVRKYTANAKMSVIYTLREQLKQEGKVVTPIWQKTYWYHQQPNLAMVRKEFMEYMQSCYNEQYWADLLKIKEFPAAIDEKCFGRWLEELKEKDLKEQIQTAEYYKNCWQI